MSSSRRELDDTAPATDVPSEPGRRSRPDTFIPPTQRYQFGAEIGRGGMGRVVEAFDTKLGRTVALKEVLPHAGDAVERRFLREVRVTARLEHPSIVPLYDSGVTAEGRPFYVMRRVSGRPLDELIKRTRGLDERLTLLPAVLRAIDAIAHAHKRGVIHRDLKPANILVGELGESIVIDWGLAKVIGEADPDEPESLAELTAGDSLQTQYGAVFGTPGFMPPEQARGDALGFGGDVYALGATLYQLLAGTPPHQGTSVTDVVDRTIRTHVTPLRTLAPGAPVELAAIVDKALAYEATRRYRDAGELAEDVRRFEAGQLVAAHHYTPRQKVGRFVRRYRSMLLLGGGAVIALAVLAVLSIRRVVEERHAAEAATEAARRTADALRDQTHELTLANATALVSTNPTMALAYLKQIPAGSRFESRARGLAQSAFARGVAWGMEGPVGAHRYTELSPSETRVLWLNKSTELRIFDLVQRRLLVAVPVEDGTTAAWLGDDQVLVSGVRPTLLDVRTGASRALDLPPVYSFAVADDERTVMVRLASAGLLVLDVATGTTAPIASASSEPIVSIAMANTWGGITDATQARFVDRGGHEIGRQEAVASRAIALPDDSLVLLGFRQAYRCWRDRAPMCTEVALPDTGQGIIVTATLSGTAVLFATSQNILHVVDGDQQATFDLPVPSIAHVGGNTRIPLGADRDTIYIPTPLGWIPLEVPQLMLGSHVTVGAKRTVIFGDGFITVFETERWLPRRFPTSPQHEAEYVSNETILVHGHSVVSELEWRDARTLAVVARNELPTPLLETRFAPTGSLIASSMTLGGTQQSTVVHIPHRSTTVDVVTTTTGLPIIVMHTDGSALVVKEGNQVLSYQPGRPAPPVMKLRGAVRSISMTSSTRFVALLETNELVIGDLSTQEVEHHPIAPLGDHAVLAAQGSTICVTYGKEVMTWSGGRLVPTATLAARPAWTGLRQGTLITRLEDRSTQMVDLQTGRITTLFEPSLETFWPLGTPDVLAAFTKATLVEVVDLATSIRWSFPVVYHRDDRHPSLSPDGTRFMLSTDRGTYEWRFERVGPDYAAWLDRTTNALIKDGKLTWDRAAKPGSAP